jgi:ABC-type antimicrobial peptide transport system permease subunit
MKERTNPQPPKWASWILRQVCPPDLHEMIEGDLLEEFVDNVDTLGPNRARRLFIWSTIKFVRMGIIKRKRRNTRSNSNMMIRHFLKIFLRTSARNAGYTIINVSGLALGLACSILMVLWVWDETHFDRQHLLRERIYQVKSFHRYPDGNNVIDATSGALADGLRSYPEVEKVGRMVYDGVRVLIQTGDKSIYENGAYVDTTIFKIFTIRMIEGTRFHDDNSIILSRKLALKYFPDESAVGKLMRINASQDAVVSGVFEDQPATSTFKVEWMMSYNNYAMTDQYNQEWGAWTGGYTFALLREGTDIKALDEKIRKDITEPRIWPRWDTNVSLFLFPFSDARLRNNFNNDGIQEGGRMESIRLFSGVGIFILIVAIINFMNLSTARSVGRSKEIGVRKVSGAVRWSLIRQFFSESLLLAAVALIVALVAVYLLIPGFNVLTNKNISLDLANPAVIGLITAITLITGLLAGSYPAFLLSSLKPVVILKGKFTGAGGKNLRKSLVVFQFALSTILVVCALAANQQMRYIKNKNLGFDRDNIVYFAASKKIDQSIDAFRKSALEDPNIVSVAMGSDNPMRIFGGLDLPDNAWPGKTKEDAILFSWTQCDEEFLPTLGMSIVKGRNFSKDNPADSLNYIINEEAARQMRLPDPVGVRLSAPHNGTIIGVVKNFNSTNLRIKMLPVIISMRPKQQQMVFVKYEAGQAQEVIASLEALYKKFEQDVPMEYQFMDAPFGEMYENEILIEKLSKYFTFIAIFISCLGLFGLASFTAETRTKEIGVRKVLGASVTQIIALLCRDFVLLIGIAMIVGLPLGWWGVDNFLERYAYRTEISLWLFVGIIVMLTVITFLSVGWQSAKAALTNPVNTLRSE